MDFFLTTSNPKSWFWKMTFFSQPPLIRVENRFFYFFEKRKKNVLSRLKTRFSPKPKNVKKIWGCGGVRYFNFRYESEKSASFSNMWGQNYLFFEIHTFNFFFIFFFFLSKILFLNFFILMRKPYKMNLKKYFFDILKYGWFRWTSW